ncbi:MAG TPA: serine/threonine-protein kinase [Chitinispirillaceae bacterium]|nr:serine/threonine-protein kinase [Chitinispirillaceae bacterium]
MSNLQPDNPEMQHMKLNDQIQNPYKQKDLPMPGPGDKIGPSKIKQLIGEGGSATVYKVWHEGLEVVRAVKVLKKYADKEARDRFLTEAKIMADLHHPNIVEIHNIGHIDQQIPFLEMEYVDGVSIRNLLAQSNRLPLSVAISVAYFVCQALHYAHTKDYTLYGKVYHGLIHRDVKPDNIIISKDGIVKLMDFGIARPSEVSLHTVGAKIMGTIVYLSPEQLNGKPLDHRSDIFSLGTVLYEMLCGARCFPQKTLTELVQKKTRGQYKPLDTYDLPFPKELINCIDKSISLEPHDRFSSISDFGHELYATLRIISDRAPQDLISRFMTNPLSIPVWKPKKRYSKKLIYSAGGAILAIASLILFILLK